MSQLRIITESDLDQALSGKADNANAVLTGTTSIDNLIAGGINLSLWGITGGLHGLRNDGDGLTEVLGDYLTKTEIHGTEIKLLSDSINLNNSILVDTYDLQLIAPIDTVENGGSGIKGLFLLSDQVLLRKDNDNYFQMHDEYANLRLFGNDVLNFDGSALSISPTTLINSDIFFYGAATLESGFNSLYDPNYGLGLIDYLSDYGYVQNSLYSGNADWAGGADSANNLNSGSWWGDIDYDTAYSAIMIGSGINEWISGTDIVMIAPYDEVSNGGSGTNGLFFLSTQTLFRRDPQTYLQLNPDGGYNGFVSDGRWTLKQLPGTDIIELGNATDNLKLLSAKTEISTTSTNANFVYIEKPDGTLAKMSKANFKTWLNN